MHNLNKYVFHILNFTKANRFHLQIENLQMRNGGGALQTSK